LKKSTIINFNVFWLFYSIIIFSKSYMRVLNPIKCYRFRGIRPSENKDKILCNTLVKKICDRFKYISMISCHFVCRRFNEKKNEMKLIDLCFQKILNLFHCLVIFADSSFSISKARCINNLITIFSSNILDKISR
jgi:hypothetical protein